MILVESDDYPSVWLRTYISVTIRVGRMKTLAREATLVSKAISNKQLGNGRIQVASHRKENHFHAT